MLARYTLNMYIHSASNGFSLNLISVRLSALLCIKGLSSRVSQYIGERAQQALLTG